ncbi:MAG: hypothetical protein AB8B50_02325 [Pirellulaceae bacterium]
MADSLADERSQWPVEFDVGSFRVHSDFEFAERSALAGELKSIDHEVRGLLALGESKARVHIVLFRSNAEYRRYMRAYFPQLPERRAMFLQDRGPGMLFTHWHPDVVTDLRHEMTHALLNQNGQALPLWLDEGIAEYFEVPKAERFGGNPYALSIRETLKAGDVQSMQDLSGRTQVREFADRDYRDSWAWVHFALHRNESTRRVLQECLVSQTSTPGNSATLRFERALRKIFPNLEREFARHFQSLELQAKER